MGTSFVRSTDPDTQRSCVVALQKGGTGKTTLTAGVAYEAARLGAQVLVVDFDPNWGLTGEHLGYDPAPAGDTTVGDLILDGRPGAAGEAILSAPHLWTIRQDLDWIDGGALAGGGALGFIPGYPSLLSAVESTMSKPANELRLRNVLKGVGRHFDLVLIDTGPRADRLAWLAMHAASTVIGSVVPEDGSAKGLTEELEFVEGYAEAWSLPLRFAGAVCTKFDKRNSVAHFKGLERIQNSMRDWTLTPTSAREIVPGRDGLIPDTEVGAVVWDEVFPQSTYVLHGQMERLPIAYGLWPDASLPPYRQQQRLERAQKAVGPYTRAALRLLNIVNAPALERILPAMKDRDLHDLWPAHPEHAPQEASA